MRTHGQRQPRPNRPGQAPATALLHLGRRLWQRRFALVYLACVCAFALQVARFGDRHTGYSSLILFGDHFAPQRLPQLADVPLYTYARQIGYDGQFYAQIAVAGNPFNRELGHALDAPAYRERRILLPLVAHAVGLGRPALIIQLFAVANLLSLVLLAALLARWWFPPTDVDNLIRWAGILFGAGLVVSATRSLTDGPALLLIAIGARQLERGRTWQPRRSRSAWRAWCARPACSAPPRSGRANGTGRRVRKTRRIRRVRVWRPGVARCWR